MKLPVFNSKQLKTLNKLKVQAVYLFGSRAQGKEGPLSDYDYAVLLKERGHSKGDTLYFKLYDLFCEVSPRTLKNDVLDIVFLRDANLEICFHIIRYGKVLYEKMSQVRLDFEIQTTLLYCDYKPLLEKHDQEILQSL